MPVKERNRILTFDLVDLLREGLEDDRREPDGLLHCSSDLLGSLRHAQLTVAGAPRLPTKVVSQVRMMTGTLWHDFFNELFIRKGLAVVQETRVAEFLPEGWAGTPDWLFWNAERRAFALGDCKTIKGVGLRYIPKDEHVWQLSAYYHALREAGYPMLKGIFIFYLPMEDVPGEHIEPTIITLDPLPKDLVWGVMEEKWTATVRYTSRLHETVLLPDDTLVARYEGFVTPDLAPPMERVQRMFKNKDQYELKLVPHWSAQFCPFDNDLCDCSEQGVTKIGTWAHPSEMDYPNKPWLYYPRKGHEDIEPTERPRGASSGVPEVGSEAA